MIVLHSTDPSTAFLKVVYEWDRDAKVFTSHRQHDEYIEAIRNAPMDEMIVFLGHGTSIGLFDTSESIGDYMIDDNDAWVLKGRQNVIGIWCFASDYARYNKLQGFYTGMFISEMKEARMCSVKATEEDIDAMNTGFASQIGEFLRQGMTVSEMEINLQPPATDNKSLVDFNYSRLICMVDRKDDLEQISFGSLSSQFNCLEAVSIGIVPDVPTCEMTYYDFLEHLRVKYSLRQFQTIVASHTPLKLELLIPHIAGNLETISEELRNAGYDIESIEEARHSAMTWLKIFITV